MVKVTGSILPYVIIVSTKHPRYAGTWGVDQVLEPTVAEGCAGEGPEPGGRAPVRKPARADGRPDRKRSAARRAGPGRGRSRRGIPGGPARGGTPPQAGRGDRALHVRVPALDGGAGLRRPQLRPAPAAPGVALRRPGDHAGSRRPARGQPAEHDRDGGCARGRPTRSRAARIRPTGGPPWSSCPRAGPGKPSRPWSPGWTPWPSCSRVLARGAAGVRRRVGPAGPGHAGPPGRLLSGR